MARTNELLHILRNPYGHTDEEKRKVMFEAADEIERWEGAFKNMQQWAEQNGLDTTTKN